MNAGGRTLRINLTLWGAVVALAGTMMTSAASVGLVDVGRASAGGPPVISVRPTLAQIEGLVAAAARASAVPNPSTLIPQFTNLNQWWTSPNTKLVGYDHAECADSGRTEPAVAATHCVYGDLSASRTIFLFGDSNAQMWIPAFDSLGYDLGWKVIAMTQASCQPWETQWLSSSLVLYKQITVGVCNSWRQSVLSIIQTVKPNYVIPIGVGPFNHSTPYPSSSQLTTSIVNLLNLIRLDGSTPLLLQPMPRYDVTQPISISPEQCLTEHPTNIMPCEVTPAMQTNLMSVVSFQAAARQTHVREVLDQALFCTRTLCPLVIPSGSQSYVVYKNGDHMTFSYSQWVSRALEALFKGVLPA